MSSTRISRRVNAPRAIAYRALLDAPTTRRPTDPALRGEMTITISLADADDGTDVRAVHDGVPAGLPTADNEAGWRPSLTKLAALVERGAGRHYHGEF